MSDRRNADYNQTFKHQNILLIFKRGVVSGSSTSSNNDESNESCKEDPGKKDCEQMNTIGSNPSTDEEGTPAAEAENGLMNASAEVMGSTVEEIEGSVEESKKEPEMSEESGDKDKIAAAVHHETREAVKSVAVSNHLCIQ